MIPILAAEFSGVDMAFGTLGGLAMFLFGMELLSDGLKMAAGSKLRALLGHLTKYRVIAMLTGTGVTCLIQSSSATTVMVVGLINAGLLSLKQAIAIILGANIGTTATGWIVAAIAGLKALKISTYAMPLLAIGFGCRAFSRRQKVKTTGQIILGLALLFIGLDFMKEAIGDLGHKHNSPIIGVLTSIGDNPILAVGAGALFTMIVQSSSASIAMVMVAAGAGGFGQDPEAAFRIAIPFVLGDNIGTTITAQLAALRTNISGKRAAMAHTLFNVLGTAIILPFVYLDMYAPFIEAMLPYKISLTNIGVFIALSHTVFNVAAAVVALPLLGSLEWMVMKVLPGPKKVDGVQPVTLEEHLLDTPPLAMQQVRREILKMARASRRALNLALDTLKTRDLRALQRVREIETTTDEYQTAITHYLVELSRRPLEEEISQELPVFMHSVNDLERVGDHAMNVAEITQTMIEKGFTFTEEADTGLTKVRAEVNEMFTNVLESLEHGDRSHAKAALENENRINRLEQLCRDDHVTRMREGLCSPDAGLLFVNCIQNLEKVGDHLANVAQGILAGGVWAIALERQQQAEEEENGENGDADVDAPPADAQAGS